MRRIGLSAWERLLFAFADVGLSSFHSEWCIRSSCKDCLTRNGWKLLCSEISPVRCVRLLQEIVFGVIWSDTPLYFGGIVRCMDAHEEHDSKGGRSTLTRLGNNLGNRPLTKIDLPRDRTTMFWRQVDALL